MTNARPRGLRIWYKIIRLDAKGSSSTKMFQRNFRVLFRVLALVPYPVPISGASLSTVLVPAVYLTIGSRKYNTTSVSVQYPPSQLY